MLTRPAGAVAVAFSQVESLFGESRIREAVFRVGDGDTFSATQFADDWIKEAGSR